MDRLRISIILLTLVCMSLLVANTVLFNFTVICMEPLDTAGAAGNGTRRFSAFEEGWIFSIVSIGAIAGTYPAIYTTSALGLRHSLSIFGIISGIATMLMSVASSSFYSIMAVRFVQGFSLALAHLACGAVPVSWGGAKSRGLFISILSVSYQLGPFMAMWNSGYFCTSPYGWQGVYYLYGFMTLISSTVFFLIYSNSPHTNRFASKREIAAIDEVQPHLVKKQAIPYTRMVKSRSFWGLVAAAIASCIGYKVFLLYGPIYVKNVLKFEVHQTGLLAALPYLLSIVSKILSGVYLDRARCMGQHIRCVSFTAFFQLAMAFSFIALTFISPEMTFIPGALFTLSMVVSGVHHVGLMNACQIIAQQYTHILTSILAAEISIGGFLLPPVIAFFVPHYSKSEWSTVFYGIAAILFLTAIIFVSLTKVKPASWTESDRKKEDQMLEQETSLSA
uniref:MFS domain-containing protein n=1 Tax=Steinernema glaseri TaxID=37863 RepID=A0A1I7YCF7_9BILA